MNTGNGTGCNGTALTVIPIGDNGGGVPLLERLLPSVGIGDTPPPPLVVVSVGAAAFAEVVRVRMDGGTVGGVAGGVSHRQRCEEDVAAHRVSHDVVPGKEMHTDLPVAVAMVAAVVATTDCTESGGDEFFNEEDDGGEVLIIIELVVVVVGELGELVAVRHAANHKR